MVEIIFNLIEIFSIMSLIILIFIYSAISTDTLTVFLCLIFFLILLLPFYFLLNQLKSTIIVLGLEDSFFFNYVIGYSIIINSFIGIYLFIELIYLNFFN
jgi:hypothetical protein